MKSIAILGSTGSVGTQALKVVEALPDRLRASALAAGNNRELLARQARRHRPDIVALADDGEAEVLARDLADLDGVEVLGGEAGVRKVAAEGRADMTLAAIVGAAGLPHVLAAVRAGRDVALANKEALVMAGALLMEEAGRSGSRILPVDSEHCALHQCLRSGTHEEVERVILTASGGPFLYRCAEELQAVTAEQALRHPRWDMGAKISVDSATLMNKALEVIEARWLFDMAPDRIHVLVHPQSLVHSLVEFRDGSLMAQVSATDMTLPIQYALTWPDRVEAAGPRLDLEELTRLDFQAPDTDRFPCLDLAWRSLEMGPGAPAVLNAANEVAVEAFLDGRLGFPGIFRVVRTVLEELGPKAPASDLEALRELDVRARRRALKALD